MKTVSVGVEDFDQSAGAFRYRWRISSRIHFMCSPLSEFMIHGRVSTRDTSYKELKHCVI
jgi:hypothetical protein